MRLFEKDHEIEDVTDETEGKIGTHDVSNHDLLNEMGELLEPLQRIKRVFYNKKSEEFVYSIPSFLLLLKVTKIT